MQRRNGAANDHEEELGGDPDEDVVGGPRLVGTVREFDEVLRLDAGTDGREDIQPKYNGELYLFDGAVAELPEYGRGDDGETRVGKGVEGCSC